MFIKKFFIISCLLSLLIACDNNKKTKHLEKKDQPKQVIDQNDNNIIENERIKQLNNDYQLFFNQYNNLINKTNKYQEQLNNCQNLIKQIQQHINEIKKNKQFNQNQKLISNYQLLIKRTKHKQQWFKNNHQSFGCFVSHFILVMVLIPIINIMNFVALFPKIKGISIVGNIVTFMFEKKYVKKHVCYFLFILF